MLRVDCEQTQVCDLKSDQGEVHHGTDLEEQDASITGSEARLTFDMESLDISDGNGLLDREEQLPVLVACSSSSSAGASSAIADSWEQADAVVETILLTGHSHSWSSDTTPSSGPLSWLCATLDYLPGCRAEPCRTATASYSTAASKRRDRHHTDMQFALPASRAFPFLLNSCGVTSPRNPSEEWARRWNGHLPLDPVPDFYYRYPCLKDKQRHRIPTIANSNSGDSFDSYEYYNALFAPSLSIEDFEESNPLYSSIVSVCILVDSPIQTTIILD